MLFSLMRPLFSILAQTRGNEYKEDQRMHFIRSISKGQLSSEEVPLCFEDVCQRKALGMVARLRGI